MKTIDLTHSASPFPQPKVFAKHSICKNLTAIPQNIPPFLDLNPFCSAAPVKILVVIPQKNIPFP
jgi:hypothetical protein